jgi:hypothetical protein
MQVRLKISHYSAGWISENYRPRFRLLSGSSSWLRTGGQRQWWLKPWFEVERNVGSKQFTSFEGGFFPSSFSESENVFWKLCTLSVLLALSPLILFSLIYFLWETKQLNLVILNEKFILKSYRKWRKNNISISFPISPEKHKENIVINIDYSVQNVFF